MRPGRGAIVGCCCSRHEYVMYKGFNSKRQAEEAFQSSSRWAELTRDGWISIQFGMGFVDGGRYQSHCNFLKYSPTQLRMMLPSFALQKMSE